VSRLLSRIRAALHDPVALAAIDTELKAGRRRIGDDAWIGDHCLRCIAIVHGSTREEVVATYDPETRTSECPACGRTVHWSEPPRVRDDPRCIRCADDAAAYEADECPPTLRDPSLPPAVPGIRDAAAGAPNEGEE